MKLKVADMLDRLHVIIDDVKRTDGEDDFSEDKDAELREALLTGAEQVTGAAPRSVLVPKPVASGLSIDGDYDYDAARTEYVDGHGAVMIPDDWLRLYELKLRNGNIAHGRRERRGEDASEPMEPRHPPEAKSHAWL